MSIITISRGSYSKGKEIAERVASRLGYECLSREVLLEASEQFDIPEIKLERAIHDAPSILERLTITKAAYISYVRVALLRHLSRDNVIYHGLAGHFFVNELPHVLKVRISADMDERIRLETDRNDLSPEEAARVLKQDDEQRLRWSRSLYGIDHADPLLYDIFIHIHKLTVDDAVEVISHTVGLERFKSSPASARAMANVLLAAEVQVASADLVQGVGISSDDGVIHLAPGTGGPPDEKVLRAFEERALAVPGVAKVLFHVHRPTQTSYSNPWYKI
jgi:cytidylate kinase